MCSSMRPEERSVIYNKKCEAESGKPAAQLVNQDLF